MKIDISQVEHIAKLSMLDLSEEEKQKFSKEFSDILSYVEKLGSVNSPQGNEVKVSEAEVKRGWLVDPTTGSGQVLEHKERINKWREDEVTREEGEGVRKKFAGLAPENDGEFIKSISPLK